MDPTNSSSSSKKESVTQVNTQHGPHGTSFEAARSRLPPNIIWEKLTPEKQKNCERAFTAASRRSDRDIDARYQSALTASGMHFLRTGKYLRVTRDMVVNEEMYEEEDSHPRLWTSSLRQESDPRIAALNRKYQNIDLQFQAAFPGFGNPSAMSTNNMPYAAAAAAAPSAAAAPQYDTRRYEYAESQYSTHNYSPVSFNSNDASPPPMIASTGASPLPGISSPSPPTMENPNPSREPAEMMMPMPGDFTYWTADFDNDTYGYEQDTAMAEEMTAMWGPDVPDEFSEFVNY